MASAFARGRVSARGAVKLALVTFLAMAKAAPMAAEGAPALTVVELFTSQGCSSCPPANANAIALSDRPDLLVLSYGVTYWDYLGWKDSFAKPEYTRRQEDYEPALGRSGPFTPQIVVDGRQDTVGDVLPELENLIARGPRSDSAEIEIDSRTAQIGAGRAPKDGADVWLIRFDPRRIEVPVHHGENGGRTLPHRNVVRALQWLGKWEGRRVAFDLPPSDPNFHTAILLQAPHGGPILAAAAR